MKTNETTVLKEHGSNVEHENISATRLCVSVGMAISICLVFYFGAMNLANLEENISLRLLNFLILFTGIVYGLHLYSGPDHRKIEYFSGMKVGIMITLVAVIPFALFIALYLFYHPELLLAIQSKVNIGHHLNPIEAAGAVCIEGISSGAIITFIAMQYFKKKVPY